MKKTIRRVCCTPVFVFLILGAFSSLITASANDGFFAIQPVIKIPAGTVVSDETEASRWNRLALLATPKINRGDTEALSASIREIVSQNALTLMVTVADSQTTNATTPEAVVGTDRRYVLREIGAGYSAVVSRELSDGTKVSRRMIITVDAAPALGIDLGFIERQILSNKEEQLGALRQIAKTPEMVVFDAPSVVLIDGEHRKATTRHLLWISSETGRGAMMVWLITGQESTRRVVDVPIRLVAFGTRESRNLHVDEKEFSFLGVPTEMAFAVADLPPGTELAWTAKSKRLAALPKYSKSQLAELTALLNEALVEIASPKN